MSLYLPGFRFRFKIKVKRVALFRSRRNVGPAAAPCQPLTPHGFAAGGEAKEGEEVNAVAKRKFKKNKGNAYAHNPDFAEEVIKRTERHNPYPVQQELMIKDR